MTVKFDPTVSYGNVLQLITVAGLVAAAYLGQRADIIAQDKRLTTIETLQAERFRADDEWRKAVLRTLDGISRDIIEMTKTMERVKATQDRWGGKD